MNVRDVTIALRPRSDWEAVDLGTALAKRYYRDLFRMGLRGFGPFFLLLALLCWFVPWLLIFLIWWGKPILDRFYLYYLSRRIFGQEVSVKETWGNWKQLVFKGIFSLLVIRRISGNRAMTLPVTELEGLQGAERRQRSAAVTRLGGGQAFLVTLGGLVLESFGLFSALIFAGYLIPQGQAADGGLMMDWLGHEGMGQTLVILGVGLIYAFFVLLLEPIYLASGFSLYLNSRTRQEAWDVELRFRELAARVTKTRVVTAELGDSEAKSDKEKAGENRHVQFAGSKRILTMMLFAGAFCFSSFGKARAQAEKGEPQVVIEEILTDKDFEWHVEKYKEKVNDGESWFDKLWESLFGGKGSGSSNGASALGLGAELLFQIVGVLALVLLFFALGVLMVNLLKKRSLGGSPLQEKLRRPPPTMVMGMAVTPESLPEDLLGQAKAYWSKGQPKLAMSLLYRGALTKLITEKEVAIENSDTESECLAQVQQAVPGAMANYFKSLSAHWMRIAYSREDLPREEFESLCANWPFERGAR